MGSGSAVPLRLPGNIPDMGVLPDGTPFAGMSAVYAVVGGRYPAGTPLLQVEVEGMASIGALVELLAAFDCVVESVLVSPGQVVRAGQALAELRWTGPGAAHEALEVGTPFGSSWSPRLSGPSRRP